MILSIVVAAVTSASVKKVFQPQRPVLCSLARQLGFLCFDLRNPLAGLRLGVGQL